jgi:pimeloyl-ACP methyl ester carboxylesterase
MDTRHRPARTPTPVTRSGAERFRAAQRRVLERYGVAADCRLVDLPGTVRRAQVLVAGEGPPVVMVIGGTVPAAFWAPLMARLPGRRLYAVELPGFGLTDPVEYRPHTLRRTACDHLTGVLDALGLGPCPFVTQSMGSQWTTWLAAEQPGRVTAQVMVGCPAFFLGTTAIVPFRLASVPGLGRLLLATQRPTPGSVERTLRLVGEEPAGLEELRDVLAAAQRLPDHVPSLLALMRANMRWTRPRPAAVTGPGDLRGVRHPVRLVWGTGDPFGDLAAARRIARLLPDADLRPVPGGHAPWFHHAGEVGDLVRELLDGRAVA